jgi:predicted alpha/beta superfamily hydrolase
MNHNLSNLRLTLTSLLTFFVMFIHGQSTEFSVLPGIQTHIVRSDQNNKDYRLQVLLPENYSASDSVKYPVLYVLDGEYSTLLFYSVSKTFSLAPELNDVIIVTIDGNVKSKNEWLTSRYYDYTPSFVPKADTAIARFFKLPVTASGGASFFLATLEKQFMPLIERKYKTNGEKAFFGHSLGGLFGGYCLLHRPALFQKYSINSPSFWWNNGELIPQVDSISARGKNPTGKILLTAGRSEGDFMIRPTEGFEKALKKNYPDVKLSLKIFEDETHLSVVPVVISRTLTSFYSRTKQF